MQQPFFTGVCTALVTPFINGEVNFPMMEQLLRRQIQAGITSVVIAGTTGEASTLSDEEKLELFRRCKKYAGNQCKIIAGTGTNNTSHAVALSKAAQQTGVDGLLVVSPYYNKTNTDGLIAHYLSIAHCVDIPIILYNVPSRTGLDMPVSVYQQLSHVSNIVGVKEASTDIRKIAKIQCACTESFSTWSGNDDMAVPAISLGCSGLISVLSNICPTETQTMVEAALSADYHTAAAMQKQLQPLMDLLCSDVNPIPIKEAMSCIGYDCGPCRLPLAPMLPQQKEALHAFLS